MVKINFILFVKMNLCVIILTNDINKDIKSHKYNSIPKVCFEVDGKSMIERCLENVIRLNPKKIIILVSKNEIFHINKLIKHSKYAKLISYCIFDNSYNNKKSITLAEPCYSSHNVLVVPGNAPLLSTRSMYQVISKDRNVKVNDFVYYLKKENLDQIDKIENYSTGDEELLTEEETKKIESVGDYERITLYFEKKNKKFRKFMDKIDKKNKNRDGYN